MELYSYNSGLSYSGGLFNMYHVKWLSCLLSFHSSSVEQHFITVRKGRFKHLYKQEQNNEFREETSCKCGTLLFLLPAKK